MSLEGWNLNNRYELTISGGAVSEDLTDFPVMIALSSGTTGAHDIFSALTLSGTADSDTTLLLHTNAGDSSLKSHPLPVKGNANISTEAPPGYDYSFYLDGSGDYIDIDNDDDLDFGTGEFTIDCWFKAMNLTKRQCIFGQYTSAGDIFQLFSRETAEGNNIQLRTVTSNPSNGFGYVISDNDWHHMAVMREGTTCKLAIDGTFAPTSYTNAEDFTKLDKSVIGARGNLHDENFEGYIAGFRISPGIVRWPNDTSFSGSLPSGFYEQDDNTSLLLNVEGDRSANKHDVTFNGSVSMDNSFGKFYGSYYFSGSASNYVSIADHADFDFGTDDFTIDWWEYRETGSQMSISKDASSYESIVAGYTSGATLTVYMSSDNTGWDIASAKLLSTGNHLDSWHHYAVVRSGTNFYTFKNGVQQDTWSSALSLYNSSDPLKLGSRHGGAYFKGYMSEVRVSKVARWTSTFKPPDSPYGSSWENRKKIAVTDSSDNELYVEIENWSDIDGISEDLTLSVPNVRYGIQADSEFSATYAATKAFLNDAGASEWRSTNTAFPHWIGYSFVDPTVSNILRIHNGISPYYATTFQIHGTNDITSPSDWSAKSWTTIATVSGLIANEWNIRSFDNDTAYIFYRLYATENSEASNSCYVNEIEFKVTPVRKEATLWTKIPTVYSATENKLYLYYDKAHTTNSGYIGDTGDTPAQNVWNSNYQLVYHFNNHSSSIMDSTGSGNNATFNLISSSDYMRGLTGNALMFNGAESINFTSLTASDFDDEATLEALVSSDSSADRALHRLGTGDGGYYPITNEGNAPYYRCYDDAFRGSRINYDLDVITDDWHVYTIRTQPGANGWQAHQNEELVHQATGDSSVPMHATPTIGAHTPPNSGYHLTGRVGDYRISNSRHSDGWRKAVYDSYFGNLFEYTYSPFAPLYFFFTDPSPAHLGTSYGSTEQLQLTVTVTGSEPSYTYDATFYDASDDSQIGSTASGINSGEAASANMSTDYQDYSWYVTATSSGYENTSSTYTFSNVFQASVDGYVTELDVPVVRTVRLYRRDTGALTDSTTSSGASGYYYLTTLVSGTEHFAVAFDDASGESYNALIIDKITPEEVT
jgi:hypothetical protein